LRAASFEQKWLESAVNLENEAGFVGFIEATYALERSDQDWLTEALRALSKACGAQRKYMGFFYDASDVENLRIWNVCRLQEEDDPEMYWTWGTFQESVNADFVRATLRSLFVGSAVESAYEHVRPILEVRRRYGQGDFLFLNALDPSGIGCVLTIGLREEQFSSGNMPALFKRMGTHLSAGYRCRRKLETTSRKSSTVPDHAGAAEAILDSTGRLLHAEGPARTESAREQLRHAVRAIEMTRTKPEQHHGSWILEGWHPLTAARWTLIDRFDENGRRYIVAHENQVDLMGFETLTDRERQIVAHAALGLSNKEIAYTLDISHTTVRVLMARAVKRLGLRGRAELLAHPLLRDLGPVRGATA
jgi:DNA-binding CsgD family transcriptional regulator